MVALTAVEEFNSNLKDPKYYPFDPVVVITGGTSGIGKETAKNFARSTVRPRIYILGRSQDSADRVVSECKVLNPDAVLTFIKADLALLKNVDRVCSEIAQLETRINVLFLCAGEMDPTSRKLITVTDEGLHKLMATSVYCRVRMAQNFQPLLTTAAPFARVVTVVKAGTEGPVDITDLPALKLPLRLIRGHISSMVTLTLERLAKEAPTVSFVHVDPGAVRTALYTRNKDLLSRVSNTALWLGERWICTPLEECGKRQLFTATTPRYAALKGTRPVDVARGSDGKLGSGVYSVLSDGESAPKSIEAVLAKHRKTGGTADAIWAHVLGEFARIAQ